MISVPPGLDRTCICVMGIASRKTKSCKYPYLDETD